MAIYLVNQGKTYKYERSGSYIWSTKLNNAGDKIRAMSCCVPSKK